MIKNKQFQNIKDKLPPQSQEAEESVLGAIIIDNNAIIKVADVLHADDFYQTKDKYIYEAVLDLYKKNEPIDILSLTNRLQEKKLLKEVGGVRLVNQTPSSAHVSHYAKIVHQKRVLRDLISASYQIAELGWSESEDVNNILDQAEQTIFSISQQSIAHDFIPIYRP